ncbi:hypothetical protein M9458_054579 [Cirrhinus mrigala]|uniref:Uncharacterized protein n=1 Tax=Cirrhinus mrigala TaxID=683832 RepID=A0ABD0MJB0_CIRMR
MPQPEICAPVRTFLASRPLEVIVVDFTVLEPASDGRENIFTKSTQAHPTKHQKADTTAKILLKEWFMKYGFHERLNLLLSILETVWGEKTRMTPYRPQGNAQC